MEAGEENQEPLVQRIHHVEGKGRVWRSHNHNVRGADERALLPEGEPLLFVEHDFKHPVPVSSLLMFGDMYPRTGMKHYCINVGLTERCLFRAYSSIQI